MKKVKLNIIPFLCMFLFLFTTGIKAGILHISAVEENDLYQLLLLEKIPVKRYNSPEEAIRNAEKGSGVIITATHYPQQATVIDETLLTTAKTKQLRLYVEFVNSYPGVTISPDIYNGHLERGIISSGFFLPGLKEMSLLSVNDCHIYKAEVSKPLLSYAKVAGFDTAVYGLKDTDTYPLLFKDKNTMISLSCLTNFKTARYGPNASWKNLWETLLRWLSNDKKLSLKQWSSDPQPSYTADTKLPPDARRQSVKRGTEWLYNGRFIIHPSWEKAALDYQSDGSDPFAPAVPSGNIPGNGSCGILEGHGSRIAYDGSTIYRYWLRNDVQGEVAFLLASAGDLLSDSKYKETSENVMDYMFYTADFRQGPRNDKTSPSYGLQGWANTHSYVFYNDDNARATLGVIGASAFLQNERWNQFIVECILANLRTCSKQGFQGGRIEEPDVLKNGWKYYHTRDYVNPHAHFESWMWACYLWLYHKTQHPLLIEKAKTAIRITMEAYPDNWGWTNGIQQERARMILPLAWLVQVEDTKEHRQWLDVVVQDVLKNQMACGAIREELGDKSGMFGKTRSNKEYGLHEAPLIANNGDPVSDMLYTSNFAFFTLNEAAHATGNPQYKEAVEKLCDFLIRIQVKSEKHMDLNGAWMRAFDYNRWDYWASNADAGWGAWSTLTGWIQSWIVGTQVLIEKNKSYWELTRNIDVQKEMNESLWMLEE